MNFGHPTNMNKSGEKDDGERGAIIFQENADPMLEKTAVSQGAT